MPKTTQFKATAKSAYGKKLATPIKYGGSFEELLAGDTVPAKEAPEMKHLLKWVNNRRKNTAKQSAMIAAFTAAGIQKPTLADPLVAFKQMVKILFATGNYDEDEARQTANDNLGTNFDETVEVELSE